MISYLNKLSGSNLYVVFHQWVLELNQQQLRCKSQICYYLFDAALYP